MLAQQSNRSLSQPSGVYVPQDEQYDAIQQFEGAREHFHKKPSSMVAQMRFKSENKKLPYPVRFSSNKQSSNISLFSSKNMSKRSEREESKDGLRIDGSSPIASYKSPLFLAHRVAFRKGRSKKSEISSNGFTPESEKSSPLDN